MATGTTSGPSLTEEQREALGHERPLFLRPPAGTKAQLAELARILGVSASEAAATAIAETLDRAKSRRR